jgi:cytochrome c oxidase subunit 1
VPRHRNLVLAHLWLAFAVSAAAAVLGVWQMWVRSPLHAPYENPQNYFLSVTTHGVSMAYVLTTFFVMGFGYFVAETALGHQIPGIRWAWAGFAVGAIGAAMAALTILSGNASVLYTFYPPLTASPFFYIGLVLVVAGSWVWCTIMIVAMALWKRANPGQPVPLAMFATVANAILWLWTTGGVAVELLFQVIPAAFGWTAGIDAFTAICRAVGIRPGSPARPTPPYQAEPQPVTLVSWTAATFKDLHRADRANGALLPRSTVSAVTRSKQHPRSDDPAQCRAVGLCTL